MSAPPSAGAFEVIKSLSPTRELAQQRPDVLTEKPSVQKTVEDLEETRRALEAEALNFAGQDGKGGIIAELTELLQADVREEAELIEMMGPNADLEQELTSTRQIREEDHQQIEHLKRAYDSLLVEITELNKQIRELKAEQVKQGKIEVDKATEEAVDLTEHAVLEPPSIPFAVRDPSVAKHQADLASAIDLSDHVVAMDPPAIPEEVRAKSIDRYNRRMAKPMPEKAAPEPIPAKPEPAAKNEAGPETLSEAQAFLAEDQREQLEVRQRLLKLYQVFKNEVLPQTQGLYEASQALAAFSAEKTGPFASLQLGAKMQLDDTKTLLPLFVGLQSEAMRNTPQDIEARTRDVQLVTARLQMRMLGLQGFRNTVLGLRANLPKGSAREMALIALDGAAGKAWQSLGGMAAEWQPIGAKVQARNGREYHAQQKKAYETITSERAKGADIKIEVPEDVSAALPKDVIPQSEDLSLVQGVKIALDTAALSQEILAQTPKVSVVDQAKTAESEEPVTVEQGITEETEPQTEQAREEAQEVVDRAARQEVLREEAVSRIDAYVRNLLTELQFEGGIAVRRVREALEQVEGRCAGLRLAIENNTSLQEFDSVRARQSALQDVLEQAMVTSSHLAEQLPDGFAYSVSSLTSLREDLPTIPDQDELNAAQEVIAKFEAQKETVVQVPRIAI